MMYHPSHHVPDLSVAEEFFSRVFGRRSTRLSTLSRPGDGRDDGRPLPDYSTFTPIADVLFDSIDPSAHLVGGRQAYPSVDAPVLKGLGWYVEGIGSLYTRLLEKGFALVDQFGERCEGEEPPTAAGSPMPLFFTDADDAGLRHEFLPVIPFPLDPRLAEGWTLPEVSDDDPLGIVRCAHHTVLTGDPARAVRLLVDVLGGAVVDRGRDEVLEAATTVVDLAGSSIRLAEPAPGSEAHDSLAAALPRDVYHSITWSVLDTDRVARHLDAVDVGITVRTDELVVSDPRTSLGIPWGFTTCTSVR